jgi:iron complex outermembrane receptor protein
MGAELTAGVKITEWLRWDANCVLSRNKILNYKQMVDLYDNQNDWNWVGQDSVAGTTTIAFSPSVTTSSLFTIDVAGVKAILQTQVVGKQYLDNTEDDNAMLRAYSTSDLRVEYQLPMEKWCKKVGVPEVKVMCQVNNLFDAKYASNGGAEASRFADGSRCCWYYAQAGINVHGGFSIHF